MEPLNALRRFWKTATFINGEEKIVLFRQSRSNSNLSFNSINTAVVKANSAIMPGFVLTIDSDKYFVVAKRDVELKLYKANTTVNIVRLSKKFVNGQFTGKYTKTTLFSSQPTMYQDINGKMQQYDIGLKSDSVKKFLLPNLAGIELIDRIEFNGENYEINVINTSEFAGLLSVQCKQDLRIVE